MIVLREQTGRLRASVRGVVPVLATVLVVYLGVYLLAPTFGGTIVGIHETIGLLSFFLGQVGIYLVAIVGGLWMAMRMDRGSLARFGLDVDRQWLRNAAVGFTISLFATAAYFGYGATSGYLTLHPGRIGEFGEAGLTLGLTVIALSLASILVANVWEEVVFRGVALQNFAEGLDARGYSPLFAIGLGVVVHAVLFGLYHVPTHGVFALYTALVGVLFAFAYLLTGRLGLAIGIHFGRFPMELLQGEALGPVTLPAVYEVVGTSLVGAFELFAIEFVVTVGLLSVWVFHTRGSIGIDDRVLDLSTAEP